MTKCPLFIIPMYENMKRDLKPDQKIVLVNLGSGTVPITMQKSRFRLWCEKAVKEMSQLGLRYKIKRRIK